jgi:hypothetical protein
MLPLGAPHSSFSSRVAKLRATSWRLAETVSSRLSIAVVAGLALTPLAMRDNPTVIPAAPAQKTAETKSRTIAEKAKPVTETRVVEEPTAASAAFGIQGEAASDQSLLQLAAARRRAKQAKREAEPEPRRTPSAVAAEGSVRHPSGIAAEPDNVPVATAKGEPEAKEPEPKPDVWSDAEIITALKECVRVLGPIAAEVEVAPPIKQEECGTPAPVLLKSVGSGNGRVVLNPPATVNCAMVAGLSAWVEKTLQPAAQETFGSPIVRLRDASGYSCRNRIGGTHNADKLSEHAKANAIDIGGFVTADGRTIDVGRFWGPTARDIRAAEQQAAQRARDEKAAREAASLKEARPEPAKATPTRGGSAIATKSETPPRERERQKDAVAELQGQGQGRSMVDARSIPLPSSGAAIGTDRSNVVEAAFLRRLHRGACGVFGTVLGPEANEAHREHFHFDMTPRKRSAYCE